jgi:NTP pyrophosphatase (non-canonical NTP hydrolase)
MKKTLTFSQLRKANSKRNKLVFAGNVSDWTPLEWGGAMAGECGEACNFLKKLRRKGKNAKPNKTELKEIGHEIADVIVYADLLAEKMGIDLGEIVREKFNIVSKRKKSDIKL